MPHESGHHEQPKRKFPGLVRTFAAYARTAWPPLRTEEQEQGTDHEDGPAVAARRVARAVQDVLDNSIQLGEVERLRAVAKAMRTKTRISIEDEEYLWLLSFFIAGRGLEVREVSQDAADESALTNLAHWFPPTMWFFLGQRWIQGLIAFWYQEEQTEKINRLFYGTRTGKRGEDSLPAQTRRARRDFTIFREVERLRREGISQPKAIESVQTLLNSGTFGNFGAFRGKDIVAAAYKKMLKKYGPTVPRRPRKIG